MRKLTIALALLALTGCSAEPGSEAWCEAKKEQPKNEWTTSDAATYAQHCILEGMTIGSEAWCEKLAERPKGDWSANEAEDYAKYCIL